MDQHRMDHDSVKALREIAHAARLMTDTPNDERAVETAAPVSILRDLRARGFITLMLGIRGKAAATLTPAGENYLLFHDDPPSGGASAPTPRPRRVFTDRDALAFAR